MKVYKTSKSKSELIEKMSSLKCHSDLLIKVETLTGIRVGNGRTQTNWELNFDKAGEIKVKRYLTVLDVISIIVVGLINLMIIFLSLCNGVTLTSVLVPLVIITLQFIFVYIVYNVIPMKHLVSFINKNLV